MYSMTMGKLALFSVALLIAAVLVVGGEPVSALVPAAYALFLVARCAKSISEFVADILIGVAAALGVAVAVLALDQTNYFMSAASAVFGLGGFVYLFWLHRKSNLRTQ